MKAFLQNFSMKLSYWMQGRYGTDSLSNGLIVLGIVFMLLSVVPFLALLSWLALICLAIGILRSFSKNFDQRTRENEAYERITKRPKRACALARKRWENRKTTLYFKCRSCGQVLSVPRGKGTLRVVCPKCKTETTRKS